LGIEKQKIFGAFQHQKFYLLSINNYNIEYKALQDEEFFIFKIKIFS
jgi:hypothetical protein